MRTVRILGIAAVAIIVVLAFTYLTDEDSGPKDFVILHTNDTHCYFDVDGNLGFETVRAMYLEEKEAGNTVFLVDGGDFISGTIYGSYFAGMSAVGIMNEVGYDVGVPGNHEFDYGLEWFLELVVDIDHPIICSNLVYRSTGESILPEYLILEKGGVKLGFFGLLTPDVNTDVKPGLLGDALVTDPYEASERMVDLLTRKHVDYVVCIGHVGMEAISEVTSDMVCNRVPGIDIFIDAHSHLEMEDGKVIYPQIDLLPSDTIIASAGCYLNAVGRISVTAEGEISAKLYKGERMENEKVRDTVKFIIDTVNQDMERDIGRTEILLEGTHSIVYTQETALTDLLADSLLFSTGAQIALYNPSVIRTSIGIGDISRLDVFNALQYDNLVVTMTVVGQSIWDCIEYGLMSYGPDNVNFYQVAGMTVTYDLSREPGHRVVSIEVDGKDLDTETAYYIALHDYLATGGGGNRAFVSYDMEIIMDYKWAAANYIEYLETIDESSVQLGRLIRI